MNQEITRHNSKFRKAQYILAAILAVIIAICLYNQWYIAAAVMAVASVATFLFLIPYNVRRAGEKSFAQSRLEDYEEVNKMGRVAYKYVQLRHIYETSTNFYLMRTGMQGAIVEKANCTPELIQFLGKIKKQYKL